MNLLAALLVGLAASVVQTRAATLPTITCSFCNDLDSFSKCSTAWFLALEACAAPPCNRRYSSNPVATCTTNGHFILPTSFKEAPINTIDRSAQGPCKLCRNLDALIVCSPSWYLAVEACAAPPCNGLYDPIARGCTGDSYILPEGSSLPRHGYHGIDRFYAARDDIPVQTETASSSYPWPTFPSVPSCATACVFGSIAGDGCAIADFACHCSNGYKVQSAIEPCVEEVCSPSERQAFYFSILDACKEVGVSSLPTNALPNTASPTTTDASPAYPVVTVEAYTTSTTLTLVLVSTPTTSDIVTIPEASSNVENVNIIPRPTGNLTAILSGITGIVTATGSPKLWNYTTSATSTGNHTTTATSTVYLNATATNKTTVSSSTSKALAAAVNTQGYATQIVIAAVGWVLLLI